MLPLKTTESILSPAPFPYFKKPNHVLDFFVLRLVATKKGSPATQPGLTRCQTCVALGSAFFWSDERITVSIATE
jgi:hypothetical protein